VHRVEYIRDLIENSIRTEYGVEADESSALQLLFNLPTVEGQDVEVLGTSDETFMVEGGSEQIIAALAQALSGQVRTGMVLRQITSQGSGFRLTFVGGEVVEADYVILAIPFMVLRDVDLEVDLPEMLRRFIDEVDLGANEKSLAGFQERVWHQEDGFVKDVWTDLGFSVAWEDTQRQPNSEEAALTFFFGGDEVEAMQLGIAKSQGRCMVQQLEQVIPGHKTPPTTASFGHDGPRAASPEGATPTSNPDSSPRSAAFSTSNRMTLTNVRMSMPAIWCSRASI
jgi:monoamine oxidase